MKFIIAKKDGIQCRGCKGYIDRGEEVVQTFIPTSNYPVVLSYHTDCYIPWFTDMFNRKWSEWKNGTGGNPLPPKRGRPIKHQEATKDIQLNRLRALRTYHKKLEHGRRVTMIQGKIDKLVLL